MIKTAHCEWCDAHAIGCLHTDDSAGDAIARELCRDHLATEMCRFEIEGLPERTHMDWYYEMAPLQEHWDGFVSGAVAFDPATVINP
jgi:hypothetical protein